MRGAVRLATLLAVIALIPSTSMAPVDPVIALAPVEVWADGFGDLQGVAIDADGAVHVADRSAGTVTRIGQDRSRTVIASGLDQPTGLAFDPAGRLVIAEEGANRVVRIEDDGHRTTVISNVQRPRWLAVGTDGTLYVSARASTPERDADALESQAILSQAPSGALTVLADGFVGLQGLAVHDEVLYAAAMGRSRGTSQRAVVYAVALLADGSAGSVTLAGGLGGGARGVALAVDSRGAIFVSATAPGAGPDASSRIVVKLRTDGSNARFAAGLADPRGLAFDSDGNLFLADGSAGRVLKFHAPAAPVFGAMPPYANVSPLSVVLTIEPGADVVVEGASPVSGTADRAGIVELTVPLLSNAITRLEAWAIGRTGDGLTSRAAETTVLHDSVAPTLDWPSPVSGIAAGVSVAIRARAADAGSGVATMTVTVDGRALETALMPSAPAASVTATATWDGARVTDGVHTVSVTASDRAGNAATLSRSVVIGTGPTPGQPASMLAVSTGPASAADPSSLRLTLAPVSAPVLQGGTTSFGIAAGNGPPGAGVARLTVDGLPAGVSVSFVPSRIGFGQTAQMLVKASPTTTTGTASFTVRAIADGGQASTVGGALTVLAGNRTALAGRVVDTERNPLARVAIMLDTLTVSTDANGNFLMLDPPVGEQVVLIDGDPASSPANRYPTIPVSLTIVANRLNELPYLPHLHRQHERFTPIHPTQKTVATDPDLPGVALHLDGGNSVIGWDGQRADKVSIRTVPVDRLPVRPLPPGSRVTKVYMFYFGKRGGGVPQQPVPFEAPNDLGLAPREKAKLWYFDESPRKGEAPNDWRVAGTGTVSADGRTIRTDPGVGIPKFCCGAAAFEAANSPQNEQPGPTPQQGQATLGADPVDLSTGIFMLSATDLMLGGRTPLAITRSYRSGDTNTGVFGLGTMMGYEEFLQLTSATVLTYVYHGDARTTFVQQPDGTYTNDTVPAFRGARITVNADGSRTLRDKGGRSVTFWPAYSGAGPLNVAVPYTVTDANGNQLTLSRPVEYGTTSILDGTGRGVTLTRVYGAGVLVATVTDPLGRTVSYQYDASNRLVSVTNPAGGVTQYTYDSLHRMTAITDARGITYLTNTYDANYRVCQQSQADSGVYTMYYVTTDIATAPGSIQLLNEAAAGGPISQAACSTMGSMSPVVATVLVDPRGKPTTYRFNGSGALTSVTDALGQTTTYDRDPATNLVQSVTDPLNRVTSYTYDGNGNALTITDPASNVRTLTYESMFSQVTSVRDPLNNPTTFTYDSHGNLTSVTDPLSHVTTITYNAYGQPVSVTDPLNQVTTLTYDTTGNLTTIADPLGNTTARSYDAVSRLISQTDPLAVTTSTTYDALNRVTALKDPKLGTTAFTYDPNGNLLSLADARGGTTSYTYNSMDRVATRTDALGHSESFAYDLAGNLSQHTNRKGQVAAFTYDALNRRTGATYADASVTSVFDAVGRLTQATDSIGGTISNAYDTLDRLTSQTMALGTLSYQYDTAGRRSQMTVPGQSPVTYAYDAASRLTAITQGNNMVQFAYDAINRRTSLTLPNGVSTEYGYDAASQLTALTHKLGTITLGDLQYVYDAGGNRIQVGGSWARTSLPSAVASATYNTNNQQLTFGAQNLTYDLNGNLTSDGTNTYTWDARNRIVAITGPVPATFVYDAAGRRSRKTINGVTIDFLYDGLNPVQEQAGSTIINLLTGLGIDEYIIRGDATAPAFFLSDALGSPVALADSSGTLLTTYTYEPFGATTTIGAPTSNPLDFTGREGDPTALKYYRARYYHPSRQRFLSEDPIEFEGGDTNLYAYVGNSPLLFIDPLGLAAAEVCCRVLRKVGAFTRLRHCYVKMDGETYGLYPKNGVGIPQKNSPDDKGGNCKPCPAMKCGNQKDCIEKAHSSYPIGAYSPSGPNSNTYAGTVAKSCCAGGMPTGLGMHPGSDKVPPLPTPPRPGR